MIRVLVIDCFDSFVYNLVQILRESGVCTYDICPADQIPLERLGSYHALILSPGPGTPAELPLLMQTLERCDKTHHILGVCLGHQAIALHFGGKLHQIPHPLHGHQDRLRHQGQSILRGLDPDCPIGRYHSWVVDWDSLPPCLEVLGVSAEAPNQIMALRHRERPIYGVQFHPESMMSHQGALYLHNFLAEVTQRLSP